MRGGPGSLHSPFCRFYSGWTAENDVKWRFLFRSSCVSWNDVKLRFPFSALYHEYKYRWMKDLTTEIQPEASPTSRPRARFCIFTTTLVATSLFFITSYECCDITYIVHNVLNLFSISNVETYFSILPILK